LAYKKQQKKFFYILFAISRIYNKIYKKLKNLENILKQISMQQKNFYKQKSIQEAEISTICFKSINKSNISK